MADHYSGSYEVAFKAYMELDAEDRLKFNERVLSPNRIKINDLHEQLYNLRMLKIHDPNPSINNEINRILEAIDNESRNH